MTELEILKTAKAAGEAEALRIWERDGHRDCGTCGGAMLELDKRSKTYKAALELGICRQDSGFILLLQPEGVRSQNMDIPEAQYRAFKKTLEGAGLGKAIKRFWTYVD